MSKDEKLDIARPNAPDNNSDFSEGRDGRADGASTDEMIVADYAARAPALRSPDMAWLEGVQGLQNELICSFREYTPSRRDKRALAVQRERMISKVTEQYVTYLTEEAKLASEFALEARDSMLRQQLAKLKSRLFLELADTVGKSVVEIERIAMKFANQIDSPTIREAYARFVTNHIFDLMDQKID